MSTAPSLAAGFEVGRGSTHSRHSPRRARRRVDVDLRDRIGVLLGDLLDVDAALRRKHAEVLLGGAVEREQHVVLLGDVAGVLDPTTSTM